MSYFYDETHVFFFNVFREVQSMEHAAPVLDSTMEMLREAIKLQQQVKQDQSKR